MGAATRGACLFACRVQESRFRHSSYGLCFAQLYDRPISAVLPAACAAKLKAVTRNVCSGAQ